jgi:predicted  nucleic acid-binding Zn-ribbon protein
LTSYLLFMHICIKCKKEYKDLKEIENGCICGSKIFIYKPDEENIKKATASYYKTDHEEPNGKQKQKQELQIQLKEDSLEHIKQISTGIFEINLLNLKDDPLVIKDQNDIYYIRLPFFNKYLEENFKHQK